MPWGLPDVTVEDCLPSNITCWVRLAGNPGKRYTRYTLVVHLFGKSSMVNFVKNLREIEQNGIDLARYIKIPGKIFNCNYEL